MSSKSLYRLIKIAFTLTIAFLLVLPASLVSADEENSEKPAPTSGGEASVEGVSVSKNIYVKDDGTYTIELDAFSTGNVTTTTVVKPCDLVLVLDVSSSMCINNISGNTSRAQALIDAVNGFLETVAEKNAENAAAGSDLSKVAIVYFSSRNGTGTLYGFTEITSANLVSNSVYGTYTTGGGWGGGGSTTTTYQTAGYGTNGKRLTFENYTWTDSGLSQANTLLQNLTNSSGYDKEERNRVVVLFTDGYPNHNGGATDFQQRYANDVVNIARTIKTTHQAYLYTLAVLGNNEARPDLNPQTTGQSTYGSANAMRVNQMLHAASSNFPQAQSPTNSNNFSVSNWGTGDYQAGYYKSATSASELESIFKEIAESSASTETPLTAESVMKDIVASSFTLPEGADASTVKVTVVPWDSTNHTWSTTGYTAAQWTTQCLNYGAENAENVSVAISEDGKTIDVTGFDYGTHFLATSDPAQDINDINKNSAKVHIEFPIQARPSAVTGGSVKTNGDKSGIYLDGNATEPLIAFPQPEVVFTPVTYVVDYVTSDTSTDTKASTVKLDYSGVLRNVQMLDDPSDDVLIGQDASEFIYKIYKGQYGTISFGDDELDVQRRYVRYAPTTMNWNGYDRIFIKGESATESDLDVWAMLCVIPANSVFYEDTYITQTKTVTYNDQEVTIEYTGIGYTGTWDTVGTEGKNQTQHAGDEMGWVTGLADDSSYANDMAHMSNTPKAKASFTFTGTGVDIYSRINGSTGTVTVKLQGINPETGKKFTKLQNLDNKAATGDFFATPVCTFTDLPYGEYTVTITVTAAAQSEGRTTFYLDGVRVYNPIQPLESEENVQVMYGEKNLGAVFTEVRSMLLSDPAAAEAEALYIDEHHTSEIVPDVAAIEAAAQDLADAQVARDEYVENNITPAKNAVSAEEYALSSAQNALDSATNIYNTLKAALDEDPDNTELQEQVANALTNMQSAQTAKDNAQAHYDANIGALNSALDAAIAGRAPYDAEIEAKRQAYEDASGETIELAYTTEDIEEYKKEGPNHEVLLDKGQSVAISVEDGKTYYIGLKSLNGNEVTAQIGNRTVTLSHSVDLYYEVTPVSGTIIIKNTSTEDGPILSVTKLRTTGVDNTTSGAKLASTTETLNVVRSLSKMSLSAYAGEILSEEEAIVDEVITEESALEEETGVMLEENEITIENEEPAVETESTETETVETEQAPAINSVASVLSRLMSSFSRFFRR